jgi:hypothetical protein
MTMKKLYNIAARIIREMAHDRNVKIRYTPYGVILSDIRNDLFINRKGEKWEVSVNQLFWCASGNFHFTVEEVETLRESSENVMFTTDQICGFGLWH